MIIIKCESRRPTKDIEIETDDWLTQSHFVAKTIFIHDWRAKPLTTPPKKTQPLLSTATPSTSDDYTTIFDDIIIMISLPFPWL